MPQRSWTLNPAASGVAAAVAQDDAGGVAFVVAFVVAAIAPLVVGKFMARQHGVATGSTAERTAKEAASGIAAVTAEEGVARSGWLGCRRRRRRYCCGT